MSSRVTAVLCLVLTACGAEPTTPTLVTDTSSDLPHKGLSDAWLTQFREGDALFELPYREADGLGPLYIRSSCNACHRAAGRGPGVVTRLRQVDADGNTVAGQPELPYGNVVRPLTTCGATPLNSPDGTGIVESFRAGIPVMGRGWMEAVDEAEVLRVQAEQALRTDGISGHVNHVTYKSQPNTDTRFHTYQPGQTVIGRFGLKARQPSLDDFAADALQGDMGLTSPLRPTETVNPDGMLDDDKSGIDMTMDQVNLIADYVRLIRVPGRAAADAKGEALFENAQCGVCHVANLATRADYPIPQLAGTTAHVFTDLLVHDMGPTLADGIVDSEAGGSEWRTAPLIGVRFLNAFLHDGRAASVDEAIRLHGADGSEAKSSVDSYLALPDDDRQALLDFVSSL